MNEVFKELAVLVDDFDRRLRRVEVDVARILEIMGQEKTPDLDFRENKKLAYRLPEVTEITGISRSTLYKLMNEGRLRAAKSGRRTLILRTELERYLREIT